MNVGTMNAYWHLERCTWVVHEPAVVLEPNEAAADEVASPAVPQPRSDEPAAAVSA